MTAAFTEIRDAALAQLSSDTGLDGELVVWEAGRLACERLQQRLARRRGAGALAAAHTWPAHLVVFDQLRLNGDDLTAWPYARRRAALEALFAEAALSTPFTLCPSTTAPATAREWLTWTAAGLEGLCFKRLAEPYRPAARTWAKYRVRATADASWARSPAHSAQFCCLGGGGGLSLLECLTCCLGEGVAYDLEAPVVTGRP
jgi:ATP-dependent DNA ligase